MEPKSNREFTATPLGKWAENGSEVEFRSVLDKLPAGAYTCDPNGLITYFNQYAAQLWGREPKIDDPVDRFCGSFRLFAADGTPLRHDQCWMALALQTGEGYNRQEIIVERPDGTRLNVLAHANPIRDGSGRLVGAVNVLVDISDQQQAAKAQALLASIVESSDDAIISKTLEGRILSWNSGAERIFGYSPQEVIGAPITLLIPPDRLDEETMILTKLRNGERIDHYETERISKYGRRIDISLTVSPIRDNSGHVIGASKVARDISARKKGEADLKRLHEMSMRLSATRDLRFILEETLRTAVAIEETDRGILMLYDPEEHQLEIGASLGFDDEFLRALECFPPGTSASGICLQDRRRIVIEDVESDHLFFPFREAARRAGFRAVHSTPLITREGKIVGVLSTHFRQPRVPSDRMTRMIDVCARQAVDFIENARLCEQLREADCRKDEFLATLAHELRNPLAPISNALQLMRLSEDLSPDVAQLRDLMQRQVVHMVRLVDDLMEVSRISRGKIELRKAPIELSAVIANAVEASRPMIDAAGHRLAIALPPTPMMLDADQVRVAQVISNLLNNAAKYMDRGGQIWLTACSEDGKAVISVRDTGLGIGRDMLPRIFDMFTQVDHTKANAQGGLGIGLTLAKRIVELHGGSIEAHSDGPGTGSEFIVRLPIAPGVLCQPAQSLSPDIGSRPLMPRRILVVDDTQAAVYVLGKLLEKMGQSVHTVQSAAAALEVVRTEKPEIVISDISMPNMDGFDLARQLRRDRSVHGVILVALTGYGQDTDRNRTKEAGFDFHLVKPVSMEALYELLASLPQPTEAAIR